mgnify:CR=1 FL=1
MFEKLLLFLMLVMFKWIMPRTFVVQSAGFISISPQSRRMYVKKNGMKNSNTVKKTVDIR